MTLNLVNDDICVVILNLILYTNGVIMLYKRYKDDEKKKFMGLKVSNIYIYIYIYIYIK